MEKKNTKKESKEEGLAVSMDEQSIQQRLSTLQKLKNKLKLEIEEDIEELKQIQGGKFKPKQMGKSKTRTAPKVQTKPKKKEYTAEELKSRAEHLELRKKVCDEKFFNRLKPLLDQIPESNGSKFYSKIKTNIGIIADEFLFNSYNGVANFHYIERDNYKKHSGKLEVLLVVTTWKGLNNEWKGLGNPNIKRHREDLYEILDFYRKQGTKIVFYSKEDPVNYDVFIAIAKNCDHVFTTAVEKIEDYKQDCNHENVHLLEFGINPLYHNPIGVKKHQKLKEVLFTGSWYEKYPHRQKDTRTIFDGVIEANKDLKIIDRNYDLKLMQYFFPNEYLKYVSPSIEHGYLQKFHKLFDWAINLNSIQESNTMFANRVYELQALGNILLSNYSVGVNNKFPGVFIVNNKEEVKDIFDAYTEEDVLRHQVNGVRQVMSNYTTFQRVAGMLKDIGIDQVHIPNRSVAVVVKEDTAETKAMFDKQTYEYKELFTEKTFDENAKSSHDIIVYLDAKQSYSPFYIEDLANGFKYTNSDYVTKDAYYDVNGQFHEGTEFDYVTQMNSKYRTAFWSEAYSFEQIQSFTEGETLENGFSIDRFNLNEPAIVEIKKAEYKLSVIIPTYNNGNHLLNKCFNSLRRSSLFEDMEVVIIDDGSTDNYTPKVVHYLDQQYANVKTYYYDDGGSGSASRPRNKGAQLTTAAYITYLDPDNEAINDGFAKLYDQLKGNNLDLVIGNMVRLDNTKELIFDYYRTAIQFYGEDTLTTGIKDYLVRTKFKAMSIQALIAKRDIIVNNDLQMVEGAVGQDTIFFQELLLHANKSKVIDEPIHIYYAAVEGSAVNTISKRFFERYLKLERYRVQMLKENGLFEDYVEQRFAYYFQNWYLKKLRLVQAGDEEESVSLLGEILELYGDVSSILSGNSEIDVSEMKRFIESNK